MPTWPLLPRLEPNPEALIEISKATRVHFDPDVLELDEAQH